MTKALVTRLKKVEDAASPQVLGWYEPAVDPDLVEVNGTKEKMTVADFRSRYPNGLLCIWAEDGETEGVSDEAT